MPRVRAIKPFDLVVAGNRYVSRVGMVTFVPADVAKVLGDAVEIVDEAGKRPRTRPVESNRRADKE